MDETDINNNYRSENNFQNYDAVLSKNTTTQNKSRMSVADYLFAYSNQTSGYCVGCVDMVDSTKITKDLGTTKGAEYQKMFLNLMAKILSRFGGFVIKNVGDCLLYYFPESSNANRKFGFYSCVECCITMAERRNSVCEKLRQKGLPPISYRISADYGTVIITKSNSTLDMIGPPVTMCSDINHDAPINGVVLGGDLYERVKNLKDYKFKHIKDFSLGFKFSYPIYLAKRR